jgi:rod shape determining protein RodA
VNLINIWWTRQRHSHKNLWQILHLDPYLTWGLLILAGFGLFILYSASNQDISMLMRQVTRFAIAFTLLLFLAQIPPNKYQAWAPWLFTVTLCLLFGVLLMGIIGKGAQRWLSVGVLRFQPSEFMKLIFPMMLAWYLHEKHLPPSKRELCVILLLLAIPVGLIAKQPDLGTALLIACSGICVIFLAGMGWRIVAMLFLMAASGAPILWHFMHTYQRERVLTFLNPERDPLGSGYHIIQSKIAIGSGGILGKGWLQGTQSHLQFLPEHATDFIFGVCGEELGLLGGITLLIIYTLITARGLYISLHAQNTFSRLLAGGLTLTFFISAYINMGMVVGILPVVGLPLPLVSYGGTSMVTMIASFGILMSIHTHRKLIRA